MTYRTKHAKTWMTAALLGCLLGTTASLAQGSGMLDKGTVSKVEIAVWDPETRDELAKIVAGDTLGLNPGDKVMLRLLAPRGHAPGGKRVYLPAKFTVAKGGGANLAVIDAAKGSYLLTASTQKRAAVIRYEINSRSITTSKPYMARGTFRIEVAGASIANTPATPQRIDAENIVDGLYQGILMREHNADNPAGRKWVALIQSQGYPGVVEAAYEIVASDESQVKVAARGHNHRARLLAIYKYLLDVEGDAIDQYQWNDHLGMMTGGRTTAVVMDIVRSPEFRRVHGLTQTTTYRRR